VDNAGHEIEGTDEVEIVEVETVDAEIASEAAGEFEG
jgi:hypothetical protein